MIGFESLYFCFSNDILECFCSSAIRDKLIPHAVSWFTGEAVQGNEYDGLEGDYGSDEEDGDDEEDEDENPDDEDEERDNGKKKVIAH